MSALDGDFTDHINEQNVDRRQQKIDAGFDEMQNRWMGLPNIPNISKSACYPNWKYL